MIPLDGDRGVRSLYIHAPFCARRCVYCDFAVHVDRDPQVESWLEVVGGELALLCGEPDFALASHLETLYVGGGTPSLLGPHAMERLGGLLGVERISDPRLEWTAEANPESLTAEVAEAWRAAGVNRLSLGAQSFDGPTLEWMGRLHGPEGATRAVSAARAAGFINLSVDLIFALPEGVDRSWERDLGQTLELDVPHISLYGLTVEKGTRLAATVESGDVCPADPDRYGDEFLQAVEVLTEAGYEHYEVSNFAKPGFHSRHNSVYWSGAPYVGVGNGAHSYRHPIRKWNLRGWEEYRDAVLAGCPPEAERESLGAHAAELEALWLGLRTTAGIRIGGLTQSAVVLVDTWVDRGLAAERDGMLTLTARGWLVMDRLTLDLEAAMSVR